MENKFEQFIVAIDFDGTICDSDYPGLGPLYEYAKDVINKWHSMGIYIIIWTCRTGKVALDAESYLLKHGINFNKFNDHHPNGLLHYGTSNQMDHNLTSKKVWSHVLIDDTSINWKLNGHPGWSRLDTQMQLIISSLGEDNKYKLKPNFEEKYLTK